MRPRDVLCTAWILGFASLCACSPPRDPRHLVLVTIDTLRADRLGAYGHDAPTSPNFDRLARRGVRFEQAFSQAISTPPSHASILTGLNPPNHGLRKLAGEALGPANVTLAEWLEARGFRTAAFVSALPLRRDIGLDQGFQVYDDAFGDGVGQRSAVRTNERVRQWIEQRADERLFLWVHYFDPHWPYLPPEDEQRRFARRTVTRDDVRRPIDASDGATRPPSPKTAALMGALYDGEIAASDAALGDLVALLEENGILDDTLLAVVSDHGECLGEHRYFFGHWDVYPETARVPMLLVHPEGQAAGTSVSGVVATVDLMPTLLSWMGFDAPVGLDGRDLSALIEGNGRTGHDAYTEQLQYRPVRALYSGRWMLRESGTGDSLERSLFDRVADRRTERNIFADHPEVGGELVARLRELSEVSGGREADPRSVSEEVANGLRELGYLQ